MITFSKTSKNSNFVFFPFHPLSSTQTRHIIQINKILLISKNKNLTKKKMSFAETALSYTDCEDCDLGRGLQPYPSMELSLIPAKKLEIGISGYSKENYDSIEKSQFYSRTIIPYDINWTIMQFYDQESFVNWNKQYEELLKLIPTPYKFHFIKRPHIFAGSITFNGETIRDKINELKAGVHPNPFHINYRSLTPKDYVINTKNKFRLPGIPLKFGIHCNSFLTFIVNGIPQEYGMYLNPFLLKNKYIQSYFENKNNIFVY